ncbi:acyltransferase [Sporosarcina sp. D27]|uniref:acyltransferase family protein n=1 Tax=Sporosarcina sp. D27 TaxID=1382305 RepID=UPI00209DFE37|nr:acyltransferase [Sporosarcina sp. D27]
MHGLRGLLSFLVVIFHAYYGLVSINLLQLMTDTSLVDSLGYMSVNLFFVISGYLIIQSLNRHRQIKNFIIDRVLRIYPVYVVIHLLIFIVGPIIGYKWMAGISINEYAGHFFSNLLLLPGLFTSLPIAQLVSWSLSYEFLFYILTALIFGTLLNYKSVMGYFILMIAIFISISFLYFHPRSSFFIVGILIFKLIGTINVKRVYKPWFYFNGLILITILYTSFERFHILVSLLLSFLLFITIINEEGILSFVLQSKFFYYLGNISYSLYLWHTFVMFILKVFMHKINDFLEPSPSILFMIFFGLSISISMMVSHLSYNLIEKRFTNYLKHRINEKKKLKANNELEIDSFLISK